MKIQIVFLAVLGLAFGKALPTESSLDDDLNQLLSLFPTENVFNITLDYLYHDREVKEFVQYIQSEQFPYIHELVEYLKQYTEVKVPCLKFFNEHGLDVYEIVLHLQDLLQLPTYEPKNRIYTGVGLHGLYEDVYSVLPLEELKALLEEKIETREYLKSLFNMIHSPVFESVVEEVQSWPEYHTLLEILQGELVDLDLIHQLLNALYWRGIQILEVELKELISLDPSAKVLGILLEYLNDDQELKELIVSIQSEKFPKIHEYVEYLNTYEELYLPCLNYINENGVDVYAIVHELYPVISEIRVILGLPPLEPIYTTHVGVGLPGLIEDVISVLPLDELKVLIENKVESTQLYKNLYTLIHTPQFLEMVHDVQALPEYQELVQLLQEIGVDVERVIELIRSLFSLPAL